MLPDDSLLRHVYSSSLFAAASAEWQAKKADHWCRMQQRSTSVLNWNDPLELIKDAECWLREPLVKSNPPDEQTVVGGVAAILDKMLQSGQNLHHPHYIGHQVAASVPFAGLFDAVCSMTNQGMAIFEMGPWGTAVDHAIVRALCTKVGWDPNNSSGLLTHGGSLANLTALLTARNVTLPDSWENGVPQNAVLISHPDAHYCVARSAGILGLGTKQVIQAKVDPDGRMCPKSLDELLREMDSTGRTVIAVSACACTTPTGTFDRLNEIADVCERHRAWLHVDAAHGGGLLMSRQHRHKLAGIERADSIVWDAHKMMFVPALCAAVLYRNPAHRFETFQQNAPYLFDPSAPGMADIDSGMRTIECTKRAAGFGLWGLWALFGESIFERLVDHTIDLARTWHSMLTDSPDFEPLNDPECNIVVFRYVPDQLRHQPDAVLDSLQRELRTRIIRSGRFYIVQTTLHGRAVLRTVVMNPMTNESDFSGLLAEIRTVGATLMNN
jgi:L-2,4-diaminobutyrate decarboxylase